MNREVFCFVQEDCPIAGSSFIADDSAAGLCCGSGGGGKRGRNRPGAAGNTTGKGGCRLGYRIDIRIASLFMKRISMTNIIPPAQRS